MNQMADNARLMNRAAFEKHLKQAVDQAVGNVCTYTHNCMAIIYRVVNCMYYLYNGRKVS